MSEERFIRTFLRGFDRLLVLWLLLIKPRSGYGLIVEVKRLTGKKLKPGLVYPFLRGLEKGGYIVGTWASRGRRRVRYYSITDKGRKLLGGVRALFRMPIRQVIIDFLTRKGKG